jgi:hypothetical protein
MPLQLTGTRTAMHEYMVAGVISILFFVAWRRKVMAQQSTRVEHQQALP